MNKNRTAWLITAIIINTLAVGVCIGVILS